MRCGSFATLTLWAPLGILRLPLPLCPGLPAFLENASRPVPSIQELGVPAGQSAVPCARCPGGGGAPASDRRSMACSGSWGSQTCQRQPQPSRDWAFDQGKGMCIWGQQTTTRTVWQPAGATRPGRVLGYTMDDHSAWGQRRESQKMSDRTRLWGPTQREKEGRAMNPSGFHGGAGRGRSGDNQRPTGTGS